MKNPKLIVKPFAKNGQKNVIPENYEASMDSNQATWEQGFGQITMLPVAAGGLPPKGQDFNGILNQISENIVYQSQGGRFKFSPEYAESIGGYPKGAILQSDDEKKEYQSLIDNNKVNFNTESNISASWELVGAKYAIKTEVDLALLKKFDKENISGSLGNDNNKVPSLNLLTTEVGKLQPKGSYQEAGYSYSKTESDGKYQPKGNYAPAGDYATNTALNNGLNNKLNSSLSYSITNNDVIWNGTHAFKEQVGIGDLGMQGKRMWVSLSGVSLNPTGESFYSVAWPTKSGTLITSADITPVTGSSSSLIMNQNGVTNELAKKLDKTSIVQSVGNSTTSALSQNATTNLLFGVNQSYSDFTSQRSIETVYTNTTGKSIVVIITSKPSVATSNALSAYVDNIRVFSQTIGGGTNLTKTITASFIVPAGSKYKASSSVAIDKWVELR